MPILKTLFLLCFVMTLQPFVSAEVTATTVTKKSTNRSVADEASESEARPVFAGEIGFTHNDNQEFIEFLRENSGEIQLDVLVDMSMWSEEQEEIFEQCNQLSPDYDLLDGGESFLNLVVALPLGRNKFDPNDTECGVWIKVNSNTDPLFSSGGTGLLYANIKGVYNLSFTYSGFGFTYYLDEK